MYRRNSILVILCWLSFNAISQNFDGGVLVGFSATQVDGDGYGGYNRVGLAAGVWVDRELTQELAIRTELKFLQKGSYRQLKDDLGGITGFYSLRLNYIEMPCLVEYRFRKNIKPFAGLSIGFLWNAKESNMDGSYPEDEIARFHKVELAGTAGVEYFISKYFSLCASISYSAAPVRPHSGNISYRLNQGQYNNVLQFYLKHQF